MKQIFINGRVFTGRLPLVEAFAVEDGRFLATGSTADLLALRAEGDRIADLGGRFVCAGFNDSHMHLLSYGQAMGACDLSAHTSSLCELVDGMRAFLQEQAIAPGGWVFGRGFNQDYFSGEKRIPTRHDLDRITTEHPVCIVRCCGHCLAVNTAALALLGIDGSTPQPDGGHYDLDENGFPTGVFYDTAMDMVYDRLPQPTRADVKAMILRACRALNRVGVTSAHSDDLCVFAALPWQEVIAAYQELEAEGLLTVRVYEQSQLTTPEKLKAFLDAGFNTGAGSELFRIGPLKILGDGSLGARTAFLRDGYADAPEEKGLALFTQEQFEQLIGDAHGCGMQVAVHAIGDGILDRILTAYRRAFAASPRADHRCGVVHVQITRPEQLEEMRRLNLHAYVQSIFLDYDTQIVEARAGRGLAATSYAFHTMKALGMHVSNGTDCPVEKPDPMRGIQCAVTRKPLSGADMPYRPEEAMTVEEALRAYTAEGAWASFEEHIKGEIAPGMLADFVVLSGDPFTTPPDALSRIAVEATWLGGQCVYPRESAQ